MKCSYYSKICKTVHGMIKHLLTYRVQWKIARCIIQCQIQCRRNNFFIIPEVEATYSLAEQIEEIYFNKEKKSLYTNNVERIDLFGITEFGNKAMRNQVNLEDMCSICT